MTYRDTILSDHEWSGDDDDNEIENEFLDQDENDDEIYINDLPSKMSDINQCVYRVRQLLRKTISPSRFLSDQLSRKSFSIEILRQFDRSIN